MKNIIIVLVVIALGVGGYLYFTKSSSTEFVAKGEPVNAPVAPEKPVSSTSTAPVVDKTKTVIGTSAGGTGIVAHHYGTGSKELLFVGGMHGGYEWNTSLVAFAAMDYLKAHPEAIPAGVKVTVIPVLNPDGLKKVTGKIDRFVAADVSASKDVQVSGRFNGNAVDLNRNFDCDWQEKGVWQNTSVSGGSAVFSEPESQAIKLYVDTHKPAAVVAWFSSAGGVYSSNCHNGVSPKTKEITNIYAKASGYPAHENFDFYAITGDMTNWLAKNGIPAISVLLTTHTDVEWEKNQKGIDALLQHYAK